MRASPLRPSPATVIATVALLVALGGTSVAQPARDAVKKLLTGKQIKNGSIASVDIRDRSLLVKDFRPGQLPGGATGPEGAAGPAGRSALAVLRSGEVVRGVIGARDNLGASLESITPYASLPIPAPVPLDNAHVNVSGNDDGAAPCTGTAAEPTAPAGYVCIYRTASSAVTANNSNARGLEVPVAGGSPYGFRVAQDPQTPNTGAIFEGIWAYTAP